MSACSESKAQDTERDATRYNMGDATRCANTSHTSRDVYAPRLVAGHIVCIPLFRSNVAYFVLGLGQIGKMHFRNDDIHLKLMTYT